MVRLRKCENIPAPKINGSLSADLNVTIVTDGLCSGLCARIVSLIQNNTNATLYAIGGNVSNLAMSYAVSPGGDVIDVESLEEVVQVLKVKDVGHLPLGYFEFPITEVYAKNISPLPLEYDFYNLDSDVHLPIWWPQEQALYTSVLVDRKWWKPDALLEKGRLDTPTMLSLGAAILFVLINGVLMIVGALWSQKINRQHQRHQGVNQPRKVDGRRGRNNDGTNGTAAMSSADEDFTAEFDDNADVTSNLI
jgi:hypothetical protein